MSSWSDLGKKVFEPFSVCPVEGGVESCPEVRLGVFPGHRQLSGLGSRPGSSAPSPEVALTVRCDGRFQSRQAHPAGKPRQPLERGVPAGRSQWLEPGLGRPGPWLVGLSRCTPGSEQEELAKKETGTQDPRTAERSLQKGLNRFH